jgi:ethanolamine utilization protein EutN
MELARIVGTVWASRKDASLDAGRLLLLQPLDGKRLPQGAPLVALDTVGAGEGEVVLYVTANEAVIPWRRKKPGLAIAGVDASIVAILDPEPRS